MLKFRSTVRISTLHALILLLVFLLAGIAAVQLVNRSMKQDALREAREKARLLLDRNLAAHFYFNQDLKPSVFRLMDSGVGRSYFDPTWMSSTYAVRQIDRYSKELSDQQYYYKECAVNARNPGNEADDYERSFIENLNRDAGLTEQAEVRTLEGKPFYVVLRRGETMEEKCMRCHSAPPAAPTGLIATYGPDRSFGRYPGEVVSAVSIRVPLETAYAVADRVSIILSSALVFILAVIYAVQFGISRTLIYAPLTSLRDKAAQISTDERRLGETIDLPAGRELQDVTRAFNLMSSNLREGREHLEELVAKRTSELQLALDNVKTLTGMLPICAHCKKIRDDDGYWRQIEIYIRDHSNADFSHSICPECVEKHYSAYFNKKKP